MNCDETPFIISGEKDVTDPWSKGYMWVYQSPGTDNSTKIYLYDYDNGSRLTEVKNFLGKYVNKV